MDFRIAHNCRSEMLDWSSLKSLDKTGVWISVNAMLSANMGLWEEEKSKGLGLVRFLATSGRKTTYGNEDLHNSTMAKNLNSAP